MLQAIVIGHLGADAEVKNSNGKEFTTLRVAHTNRWDDDNGNRHEETTWVDCIMNGKPNVVQYLKRGQMVYISGSASLRCYSSPKERCFKAGLTINVRTIELLGGKSDDIPNVLYDANTGAQVEVKKWFNAPSLVRDEKSPEFYPLLSRSQEQYVADRNGWIQPYEEKEDAQ